MRPGRRRCHLPCPFQLGVSVPSSNFTPHLSPSDPPPLPSSAALHPTPPPFPDALLDLEYPTSEDEPDAPSPTRHVPSPRTPHPPHPTSVPSPRPPPPPRTPPPQRSATPSDISPREQRAMRTLTVTIKPPRQLVIYIASHAHPWALWTAQSACLRIPSAHIHPASPPTIFPGRGDPPCFWAIEHDPAASLTDRLLGDYRSLLSFASVINLRVDQLEPSQSGYETIGTVAYARTAHTHVPALTGEAIPPHLDPLTPPIHLHCTILGAPERPGPRPPPPQMCPCARPLCLSLSTALVMLLASTRPEVQTALAAHFSQGRAAYEVCHNLDSRVAVGPFGIHLHWDDKTWQNKNQTLMRAIEVTEMEFPLSFASAEEVEIHTGLKYWGNLLPGEAWCHRNASETKLKRALVTLHEFKIRVMNAHHCPPTTTMKLFRTVFTCSA
ncbi:hypothetical protein K439DRAFT_1614535 [Ramaria rubella]|nr:hypothetical protein K439DRAFT_1614535 [Ramaria rubella]